MMALLAIPVAAAATAISGCGGGDDGGTGISRDAGASDGSTTVDAGPLGDGAADAGPSDGSTDTDSGNIHSGDASSGDASSADVSSSDGSAGDGPSIDAGDSGSVDAETVDWPDPSQPPPPLPDDAPYSMYEATRFLYEGANPIQRGVVPGTLDPRRVAVVRGKVVDRDGQVVVGAAVRVVGAPQYGESRTKGDGIYDLAVNGGVHVTLEVSKAGFLPVQRRVRPAFLGWAQSEDVVLTPLDPKVTHVTLSSLSSAALLVEGSKVVDARGTRTGRLFFAPGTHAEVVASDGSRAPIDGLGVRITEYTTGPTALQAMPGDLPRTSVFTYAAELSVDEAMAIGAQSVVFDQPVSFYLDNFLGVAVGEIVPIGFYDATRGVWAPSDNGLVIEVLRIDNGKAVLDVEGAGNEASDVQLTALGLSDEELRSIAATYAQGTSFWRGLLPHFSSVDLNFPGGPDCDDGPLCYPPDLPPEPDPEDCESSGSIIHCESQELGECIPLAGTAMQLCYSTEYARRIMSETRVPVSGPQVSSKLKRIESIVSVAGQRFAAAIDPSAGAAHLFQWDGRDAWGRPIYAAQAVEHELRYVYNLAYSTASRSVARAFAARPSAQDLEVNPAPEGPAAEFVLVSKRTLPIQIRNPNTQPSYTRVGDWSLSAVHELDPETLRVTLGDGGTINVLANQSFTSVLKGLGPLMGALSEGYAFNTRTLEGFVAGPDNALYVIANVAAPAQSGCVAVFRVEKNGTQTIVSHFAGGIDGSPSLTQLPLDGQPSKEYCFGEIKAPVFGPEGQFYFSSRRRIYRVDAGDALTHVAGSTRVEFNPGNQNWVTVDRDYTGPGPATERGLGEVSSIAIAPSGEVYILGDPGLGNRTSCYILEVTPDGLLRPFFGLNPSPSASTICEQMPLFDPNWTAPYFFRSVSVDPTGSVILARSDASTTQSDAILRLNTKGQIETITGDGLNPPLTGRMGQDARLIWLLDVFAGSEGDVYFEHEDQNHSFGIWRQNAFGALSLLYRSNSWAPFRVGPDGTLFISLREYDDDTGQPYDHIIKLGRTYPPLDVPSASLDVLYQFDAQGRHVSTIDALTGTERLHIAYDGASRLSEVTAQSGDILTIERDTSGQATAIVAPGNIRTTLAFDGTGRLASVTDPVGGTYSMQYGNWRQLSSLTTPSGRVSTFTYDSHGKLIQDANSAGDSTTLSREDLPDGHQIHVTRTIAGQTTYALRQTPAREVARIVTSPDGAQTVSTNIEAAGETRNTTLLPNGTRQTTTFLPDPTFGMLAPYVSRMEHHDPASNQTRVITHHKEVEYALEPGLEHTVKTLTESTTFGTESVATQSLVRQYVAAERTLSIANASAQIKQTAVFDAEGRLVSAQFEDTGTARLRMTSLTYDGDTNRIATMDGPRTDVSDVFTFSRDALHRVTQMTDPSGGETIIAERDARGLPTHILSTNGADLRVAYNASGAISALNRNGRQTQFVTDDSTKTTAITMPGGGVWTIVRNGVNDTISEVRSPEGERVVKTYEPTTNTVEAQFIDAEGNVQASQTTTFDDGASTWRSTVDGRDFEAKIEPLSGRPTSVSVGGRSRALGYDADGRMTSVVNASGASTTLQYSADGSKSMTDALGVRSSWVRGDFGLAQQFQHPALGATNFEYDASGHPITIEDALGTIHTRRYDALGRVTHIVLPDDDVVMAYDEPPYGHYRLTSMQNRTGRTHWAYNIHGEVVERSNAIGDVTLSVQYERDNEGRVLRMTYPSGMVVSLTRDLSGRCRSISALLPGGSSPVPVLSEVTYMPFGPMSGYLLPGGQRHTRTYDALYRPTEILTQGIAHWRYAYNAAGGLTRILLDEATYQDFTYDPDLTLSTATGPYGQLAYTFDRGGNLRQVVRDATENQSFAYDAPTGRLSTMSGLAAPLSYDAAGRTTSLGDLSFAYDAAGRLTAASGSFGTAIYDYNGRGQRVSKEVAGARTVFVYDDGPNLLGEYRSDGTLSREIIWLDNVPVATLEASDVGPIVEWITTDYLGTPRYLSNLAGDVVWSWSSDPFGRGTANEDPDADQIAVRFNLRFAGQYFDPETGLHQNNVRTYSPELHRYLEPDPMAYYGSAQLYAYGGGNPVQVADPLGMVPLTVGGREVVVGPPLPENVSALYNFTKDINTVETEVLRGIMNQCGISDDVVAVMVHGNADGSGMADRHDNGSRVTPEQIASTLSKYADNDLPIVFLACYGGVCDLETMTSNAQKVLEAVRQGGGSCPVIYSTQEKVRIVDDSEVTPEFAPETEPPSDLPDGMRDLDWMLRTLANLSDQVGQVLEAIGKNGPNKLPGTEGSASGATSPNAPTVPPLNPILILAP
ncbi:MAG: RHS repeat protein [Deltaproteobacteria bacterium]|nr:RHS repeat protein [Deltaproteobacteria bacterium]